jgi:hypothetical protein
MKLYFYGFWGGFVDKTDRAHIIFFLHLFKLVFNENIEIGNLFLVINPPPKIGYLRLFG